MGRLTRAHGLAADNLLAVELVTADGAHLTATPGAHPDLFWALRGGGGNFGVVTAFTFRAHPLGPTVLAGNFLYGVDRWGEAWAAVRRWTRDLPDDMTTITTTLTPPPLLEAGDQPLLVVGFAWASPDRAAGEALIEDLRALAAPDDEEVGEIDWCAWQSAMDGLFPKGVRASWRNVAFDDLSDGLIDVLVARGSEQRWLGTAFDVHHMGGAFGRGLSEDLAPFAAPGQYVNFQGAEPSGHRSADPRVVFGDAAYRRLAEVKRRYDPDNVFRLNANIDPAG